MMYTIATFILGFTIGEGVMLLLIYILRGGEDGRD